MRPGIQRTPDVGRLFGSGNHDQMQAGGGTLQRFDAGKPIHAGHVEVNQSDVYRRIATHSRQGLNIIRRLDHIERTIDQTFKNQPNTLAKQGVVIGEQNFHYRTPVARTNGLPLPPKKL